MNENNNTSEHTPNVRSNNFAGGTDAVKNDNAPRDRREVPTQATSSTQSHGYKKHTQDDQSSSHYPRRNNAQGGGFQRNNYGGGSKRGGSYRSFRKEKYDKIAAEKLVIDYKQPDILKRFLTDGGKIFSRYITGNSAKNQRRLGREVKRARFIGFLPSA